MVNKQQLDINELVNLCKDEEAKQHIAEAVICYKVGAFRSCIISTWLAVVFNYIHKLRELALLGDPEAEVRVEELDDIQKTNDLDKSMKFEREFLDIAKDKFELISSTEVNELKNLYKSRNCCAHPSMNADGKIYQPTQTLTLYYIEIAVKYLLQHEPMQGKAALERLQKKVKSINFPNTKELIIEHFKLSPLSRARESLIRSFIICLLKTLIKDQHNSNSENRHALAFNAVWEMYPSITETILKAKLNTLMLSLTDEEFEVAIKRLRLINDYGKFIKKDVRELRRNCLNRMYSKDPTSVILIGLKDERLRHIIVENLKKVGVQQLLSLVKTEPHPEFVPRAVELYVQSNSWKSANKLGTELIIPLAKYLTAEYIETIIKGISENKEVESSFKAKNVLMCIQSTNIISEEEFNNLIKKYSLEKNLS